MKLLGATFGFALAFALAFAHPANADGVGRTYPLSAKPYPMSGQPRTIAIDPTNGRVLIANSAGFLTTIDPISGQVTDYPTSGNPNVLTMDSVHRRVYVANYGTIDVFDLATMAIVATLPVSGKGLAVDTSTQRVYAVGATELTVIDGTTNTVLTTRPALAGEDWFSVALDPALHRIYVANYFEYPAENRFPSLVVLDDRDLAVISELPLPVRPRWGLAVDQVRHRVYVAGIGTIANAYLPRLVAFDGSSLAQVGIVTMPGDPEGIAVGVDQIYVSSQATGYTVVDANTFQVRQSLSTLPLRPFLVALDASGLLYFGSLGGYSNEPSAVVAVSQGNHPPVITVGSFYPFVPKTNDVLQFFFSAVDGDFAALPSGQGDPVTVRYEWVRNGSVIPGETASTLDLSRSNVGDRGDTITARITVSDPQGLATIATPSVVIANSLPVITISLSDTAPGPTDVLIVTASASDADGDPVTLSYEWLRNGVAIPAVTTASLDLAAYAAAGDSIVARAIATDDHGGVQVAGVPARVIPETGTFLFLKSEPGDFIGQGREQLLMSPPTPVLAWLPQGSDTFRADLGGPSWTVYMSAPRGVPLAVGVYTGAVRSAFRPAGTPGLDVSGDHGCNTVTGQFTVNEIAYSQYNELMLFDAVFEQHCDGVVPALFGHIRVEIPPPTPGVTLPVGSITVPTSGSFLYMNSQGEYIGQGREQLYTWNDSAIYAALPLGGNHFTANLVQGNYVHWWYVDLAAPEGQELVRGSYVRAGRWPFASPGIPALSVDGDGRGCNTINGKFDVDELSFSPSGDLLVFQATFEQRCENAFNSLFGRIRIEVPTAVPGVVLPSGSITIPTSGNFLYVNSVPGESVGGGVEALYTAATSTLTASFSDYFRGSVAQGSHTWSVEIASPQGQALAAGSYVKAIRASARTVMPGIDIRADGRSCADITGKFDVNEMSFWPNGEIRVFEATFQQQCLGKALFGKVRVEMAPPVELTVTMREEGSVDKKSGVATVAGTLACSRAATVDLYVTVTQVQSKSSTLTGTVIVRINCTGPSVTWSQAIPADSGMFKAGSATGLWNANVCESGRRCVQMPGFRTIKLNAGK
jgi:hypothetical protein